MASHNCENCGKEVFSGSGVTHSTFFESTIFHTEHWFCCKKCRDEAIKSGKVKGGSNGCAVLIFIIIAIIAAVGVANS